MMEFKNCRLKKIPHVFIPLYSQAGDSRLNQQLPINVLRRGPIKYFSINYN